MTLPATFETDRPTAVPDHLWAIDDLARFLRRCENTARRIAELPDAPPAVFRDGKGALWDPRSWWAWADARQAIEAPGTQAEHHGSTGRVAGTRTRV